VQSPICSQDHLLFAVRTICYLQSGPSVICSQDHLLFAVRTNCYLQAGPSVIIYIDEQIKDIKRFCAVDDGAILGIDKTYNLGKLHLTTTVFKSLSVKRTGTQAHPIILGPCFLHAKSNFETFNIFFSSLASHLTDDEIQKIIVGSDDECALRRSFRRCLPGSTQIICTRNLKNNVIDYFIRKVGVMDSERKEIVHRLFGENGLSDVNSTVRRF